jgi:hypothetical protein
MSAKRNGRKTMGIRLDKSTVEQRRRAEAVLEVLAGARSPSEAAEALSMSLPAYYKLESRALEGLVAGCRTPERGPRPSAEKQLARSQAECRRLQQQLQRYQALARAAQRTVGLRAPKNGRSRRDAAGRRRRRPTVRALKAVETLRAAPPADSPEVPSSP